MIKIAFLKNKKNILSLPGALIFRIVVIKFIAPSIDEIPAKCKLNIAKSIEPPECDCKLANGG